MYIIDQNEPLFTNDQEIKHFLSVIDANEGLLFPPDEKIPDQLSDRLVIGKFLEKFPLDIIRLDLDHLVSQAYNDSALISIGNMIQNVSERASEYYTAWFQSLSDYEQCTNRISLIEWYSVMMKRIPVVFRTFRPYNQTFYKSIYRHALNACRGIRQYEFYQSFLIRSIWILL